MTATSSWKLTHESANLIGGRPHPIPGDAIVSHNPAAPDEVIWSGSPRVEDVNAAVDAAHAAGADWAKTPIELRIKALRAYQALARERVDMVAELLCDETGKALWDAKAEAGLLAGKIDITLAEGPASGRSRVTGFEVPINDSRRGVCNFRPHGVMAVIGPFNFPAHLPNGHIAPALLTGNTIVFKPSDKTPAVGQMLAELYIEALDSVGAPAGTFNLLQGGADVASSLVAHNGVDGVLFTGSWPVARRILEANLDMPGRMVALELGGNNPAIVMPDANIKQAALECARAAFVTTGQRCTCTRRLIVHRSIADQFTNALARIASNLHLGPPRSDPQPFFGPAIRAESRDAVLDFQKRIADAGAEIVLEATAPTEFGPGHYITPGIARVDRFSLAPDESDPGCDKEVFGPFLRVAAADSFDDALEQANATRYGLASALFSTDDTLQHRFLGESRAGCVNINTGTAGASGKLPFGGLGQSGNHRPAGAFSLDYCAYPVASLVETGDDAVAPTGMAWDDAWLKD